MIQNRQKQKPRGGGGKMLICVELSRVWDVMDEYYLMNDVKHKLCYVSLNFLHDLRLSRFVLLHIPLSLFHLSFSFSSFPFLCFFYFRRTSSFFDNLSNLP